MIINLITVTFIIITNNKASAGDICITEEPLSKNSAKTWKTHRPLQLFQVCNSKWEEEKTSSQVVMKNFVDDLWLVEQVLETKMFEGGLLG